MVSKLYSGPTELERYIDAKHEGVFISYPITQTVYSHTNHLALRSGQPILTMAEWREANGASSRAVGDLSGLDVFAETSDSE